MHGCMQGPFQSQLWNVMFTQSLSERFAERKVTELNGTHIFRFCNHRLTVTSYFPCSFHKCTMTAKIHAVSSSATGNLTFKIVCIFTIVGFRWLLRRSIIICIFSHWCPLSKKVYFSKDYARELVEYLLPLCLACPSGM